VDVTEPLPPRLTVEQLQRRLRYPEVTFLSGSVETAAGAYEWAEFRIHPQPETSEALFFLFDPDIQYLQSLNFGNRTHWHFERSPDERINCDRAVRVARALVLQRMHMVEQLDQQGKAWGWSLQVKDGLPLVYDPRMTHYRRLFFNRAPGPPFPIPSTCRRHL
jgi:hypothetical protein